MRRTILALAMVVVSSGGWGCDAESVSQGGFESADPAGPSGMGDDGTNTDSGGEEPPADEGDDPSRAIEEADIVQLRGDTLYALSQYDGLTVIDASTPTALQTLGRFRRSGEPFEMYLDDNVVLALYSSWPHWEQSEDGYDWVTTSQVVALDVTDPGQIETLASLTVPGAISDSRRVGDVLYIVSYENGWCWDCASDQPRTTVLSVNVSDPRAMAKVEELSFEDASDEWGWGRRSISVNTQRLYVAGREDSPSGPQGSTIQVVDISDPGGAMALGATLEAEGEIRSRWQMSEFGGVLRVVSQPPQWRSDSPPVVQTFQVESADDISPLGRLEMVLPRPEELQSVRFDGERAYAITFERTDPLFTLDLSDPARPLQRGELEIPGWVFHMEPRGERLLGFGYEQGNDQGALHASIFDVSDMDAPTMLSRVNFGGQWAQFPEDQDRIHKALTVLDDRGLMLVPSSGWDFPEADQEPIYCEVPGDFRGGVQLVRWADDALWLAGFADTGDRARRALLHREHLLTVSDERVGVFDIADLDAPMEVGTALLARNVRRTAVAGELLVRLGNDWWRNQSLLDVVPLSDPGSLQPLSELDMEVLLGGGQCEGYFHTSQLMGHGQWAYLFFDGFRGVPSEDKEERREGVAVIDLSDPASPSLSAEVELETARGYYAHGQVPGGESMVQVGSAVALLRADTEYVEGEPERVEARVDIVDLSTPDAPVVTSLPLPADGGLTGLHVRDDQVFVGFHERVSDTRVRFHVTRMDVSDAAAPVLAETVNVPGSLLAVLDDRQLVTADYARVDERAEDSQSCFERWGYRADFRQDDGGGQAGDCSGLQLTVHAVRLESAGAVITGSHTLEPGQWLGQAQVGAGRVFVPLSDGYSGYDDAAIDCWGPCGPSEPSEGHMLVLSGLQEGLQADVVTMQGSGWSAHVDVLAAVGTRALVAVGWGASLLMVDASDPSAATVQPVEGPNWRQHVTVVDDQCLISSGHGGVQVVPM